MSLTTNRIAVALISLMLLAPGAGAMVLWDQGTIVPAGPGIPSSNSPGFGGFVIHSVNDVTVPASGWHVTSITAFYGGFNSSWTSLTQGYLYVQPKTGALPTLAPAVVQQPMSCVVDVPLSTLLNQTVYAVTANVNLDLVPGEYWIGIAPTASAGINGANRQWPSATVGDPVASYNAPNPWANIVGNWDSAWIINGEITVPVETNGWGAIKSLYR